jgi:DNA-binding LacI/PurR family transcriptional regulator
MRANKRVTHQDVAKLAGVSPAVVSYVINNGPRATSPEARRRVLEAIEALSYHPSASARDLRMQRTRTIAFIYYDYHPRYSFVSPYIAGVLTGLSTALQEQHYYMLPYWVGTGEDLGGYRELIHSGRVDGVVLRLAQDPPITDEVLEIVASAGVPCVTIERPGAPRFGVSAVTYDDESAAFMATSYLIERGHRRIGHLRGDPGQMSSWHRADGYRRALTQASLPVDDDLIQGGGWTSSIGIKAMRSLLALDSPPTAVFAGNDQLALGAIEVLRDSGRRIPRDVAVVGFDDVPLAQELLQPLTTVRIPFADLGRRAAALILRAVLTNSNEYIVETVPLELIRRETA